MFVLEDRGHDARIFYAITCTAGASRRRDRATFIVPFHVSTHPGLRPISLCSRLLVSRCESELKPSDLFSLSWTSSCVSTVTSVEFLLFLFWLSVSCPIFSRDDAFFLNDGRGLLYRLLVLKPYSHAHYLLFFITNYGYPWTLIYLWRW